MRGPSLSAALLARLVVVLHFFCSLSFSWNCKYQLSKVKYVRKSFKMSLVPENIFPVEFPSSSQLLTTTERIVSNAGEAKKAASLQILNILQNVHIDKSLLEKINWSAFKLDPEVIKQYVTESNVPVILSFIVLFLLLADAKQDNWQKANIIEEQSLEIQAFKHDVTAETASVQGSGKEADVSPPPTPTPLLEQLDQLQNNYVALQAHVHAIQKQLDQKVQESAVLQSRLDNISKEIDSGLGAELRGELSKLRSQLLDKDQQISKFETEVRSLTDKLEKKIQSEEALLSAIKQFLLEEKLIGPGTANILIPATIPEVLQNIASKRRQQSQPIAAPEAIAQVEEAPELLSPAIHKEVKEILAAEPQSEIKLEIQQQHVVEPIKEEALSKEEAPTIPSEQSSSVTPEKVAEATSDEPPAAKRDHSEEIQKIINAKKSTLNLSPKKVLVQYIQTIAPQGLDTSEENLLSKSKVELLDILNKAISDIKSAIQVTTPSASNDTTESKEPEPMLSTEAIQTKKNPEEKLVDETVLSANQPLLQELASLTSNELKKMTTDLLLQILSALGINSFQGKPLKALSKEQLASLVERIVSEANLSPQQKLPETTPDPNEDSLSRLRIAQNILSLSKKGLQFRSFSKENLVNFVKELSPQKFRDGLTKQQLVDLLSSEINEVIAQSKT